MSGFRVVLGVSAFCLIVVVRARPGYLATTPADVAETQAVVPDKTDASPVRSSARGRASRRGPSTALKYVPSTDSDYRRTERLRFEVAAPKESVTSARLLGPTGTPINVSVALSNRVDETTSEHLVVAELSLAPLAQAEYELELTIAQGEHKELVTYRFAVVP